MLSLGIIPSVASSSVHTSGVFSSLILGVSHFKMGNVKREIVLPLAVSGSIGGIIGVYVLIVTPTTPLKIIVGVILFLLGCLILYRFTFNGKIHVDVGEKSAGVLLLLGFAGAFLDAIGGGGWGPIVTPPLILNHNSPQKVLGSVIFAKFFVSLAITLSFFILIGFGGFDWNIIIAWIIGGLISAPIAVLFSKRLVQKHRRRRFGQLVGLAVVLLSLFTLFRAFL